MKQHIVFEVLFEGVVRPLIDYSPRGFSCCRFVGSSEVSAFRGMTPVKSASRQRCTWPNNAQLAEVKGCVTGKSYGRNGCSGKTASGERALVQAYFPKARCSASAKGQAGTLVNAT